MTTDLPSTRRAVLLDMADRYEASRHPTLKPGTTGYAWLTDIAEMCRERAGDYPEADTSTPFLTIDHPACRVAISWPTGRGPVTVTPEAVESIASRINGLVDQLDEARSEVAFYGEWSNELAAFVPDDGEHGNPEGTQEGVITAYVQHLQVETEKLRGLLRAAVDGWEQQVITGDDGFSARANIRDEAGLT